MAFRPANVGNATGSFSSHSNRGDQPMTKISTSTLIPLLTAVAATSLLMASPALAQSGGQMATMLDRADRNADGRVTWGEFTRARSDMFDKLDRNDDGNVDRADRPSIMGDRFDQAYRALSSLDANGDRRVSRTELRDGPADAFDAADTNGDSVLTADELATLRPSR
jgi:Ca2+-binding EF-hand superfamily protein